MARTCYSLRPNFLGPKLRILLVSCKKWRPLRQDCCCLLRSEKLVRCGYLYTQCPRICPLSAACSMVCVVLSQIKAHRANWVEWTDICQKWRVALGGGSGSRTPAGTRQTQGSVIGCMDWTRRWTDCEGAKMVVLWTHVLCCCIVSDLNGGFTSVIATTS